MSANALISVAPPITMSDAPLQVTASGLAPNSEVTVRASLRIGAGDWTAEAAYRADAKGALDLSKDAPLSGSFSDADPMGLIWSMAPAAEASRHHMLEYWTKLEASTIRFSLLQDGEQLASAEAERLVVAPGVERLEVREDGLFATLFTPAGAGPHPAITLLSGSGGGLNETGAALFAAHGYAALTLAYFNFETLPESLVKVPLEYFEASIAYLQARADIDGDRLAVTGVSRGGELALLLGSMFAQYKVVIADAPSGIVWSGFGANSPPGSEPAWTWRGGAIPFMDDAFDPTIYAYIGEYMQRGEAMPLAPSFRETLRRHPATAKKAEIPVEQIQGAVLMISGEEDAMWPSSDLAEVAMERLRAHQFPHVFEHIRYPEVGHLLMPPYAPTTLVDLKHPVDGGFYAFGGEPAAIYRAGVDAWRRRLDFLRQHL